MIKGRIGVVATQLFRILEALLQKLSSTHYLAITLVIPLLLWNRARSILPSHHRSLVSNKMHLPLSPPSSPISPVASPSEFPHLEGEEGKGVEGVDFISSYFLDQSQAVKEMYDQYSSWSYSFLSETGQQVFGSYYSNVSSIILRQHSDYVHKIPTSFAMSGCGWLIPFHLGVIQQFKDAGYLNDRTIFAGTSGGAIGALVGCCDIPTEVALDALIQLSKDEIFKNDIDKGLKQVLRNLVLHHANGGHVEDGKVSHHTKEVLRKCNSRLHITVTKLWPNPTFLPQVVSQFHSSEHMLDVVAASCFIPLYSSPLRVMTNIMTSYASDVAHEVQEQVNEGNQSQEKKNEHHSASSSTTATAAAVGEYFVDGGVLAFIPPIGEVKISPFPSKYIRSFAQADITLSDKEYSLRQLLTWVLHPGSEEDLRGLYEKGKQAAQEWIVKHEKYVAEEEQRLKSVSEGKETAHPEITSHHHHIKMASVTHTSFTHKTPSITNPDDKENLRLDVTRENTTSSNEDHSPKSNRSTSPLSPITDAWMKLSESTEQSLSHLKSSALRLLPSALRRLMPKR